MKRLALIFTLWAGLAAGCRGEVVTERRADNGRDARLRALEAIEAHRAMTEADRLYAESGE